MTCLIWGQLTIIYLEYIQINELSTPVQSVGLALVILLFSILATKMSPGLKRSLLCSTKAFSKNIECLYVGLPILEFDSTLYNLVQVWETTITVETSRISYGQRHAYVYTYKGCMQAYAGLQVTL